jgi:hypothetical protein
MRQPNDINVLDETTVPRAVLAKFYLSIRRNKTDPNILLDAPAQTTKYPQECVNNVYFNNQDAS